jgi:DNA-binding protein YbaB
VAFDEERMRELRASGPDGRPNWGALESMFSDLRSQIKRTKELQNRILEVTGTAWSDDRMIKATVGPRGQLIDLDIDPRVYRRPNSKALAISIVQTTKRAVEQATAKTQEILEKDVPADMRIHKIGGIDARKLALSHDADLPKQLDEEEDDGDLHPGR